MAQNEGRTLRRAPQKLIRHAILFVLLVVTSTVLGLGVHQLKVAAQTSLQGANAAPTIPQTDDHGEQATAPGSAQVVAVSDADNNLHIEPSVSSCTRGHYNLPTTINLTSLPAGVTTIEDSPQTYVIFGNTVQQQQEQLQRCAPVAEFAGAASYQVSWQYSYGVRSDGQCEIITPKIGLHLNMVLPKWSATGDASDSARSAWASFSTGLNRHEQGHYAISRSYAKTMLGQLQHVTPQDCGTIRDSADAVMASLLKQLRAAQDNYDATTNHGATQGAVL